MPPPKLKLAHLPTPLFRSDALDALVGTELWVKRDDMSAGPAAGNKIRKLEYLLAEAQAQRATVVITCGGLQSNHARATAILARQLGLRSVLLLRCPQPQPPPAFDAGNAFLDALVGAEIRPISKQQYAQRTELMHGVSGELARRGERPYVIPEGGSCGLGALGYVDAMAELREQLDRKELGAPARFDAIVHACGSGGTAAGVALGAALHEVADRTLAIAVCDDRHYFERVTAALVTEARALLGTATSACALEIIDRYKGPAYGVPTDEQAQFIVSVARACGLVLDPVYTGKALYALAQIDPKPRRALFIHTGGLPGLLAESRDFTRFL
ncbi:MAG: 1-aminocyclopropane-1-carboxylate deaminase/D-cysteine desulfhydrase [Polyangiales bacterium]